MGTTIISINDILWLAAAFCSLMAVWKVLKDNPVSKHEKKLFEHDEILKENAERLQDAEAADKIMCKCLLALIDHEITGNGIEKMKNIKSELQEYLIRK